MWSVRSAVSVVLVPWALGLAGCGVSKRASGSPDAEERHPDAGADAVMMAVTDGATDLNVEGCPVPPAARPAGTPTWTSVSGLKNPQAWYATPVAAYVAESVLSYQNANGGWPKNIDMTFIPGIDTTASPRDAKSMIDNSATTTQVRFMAYMVGSWPACERFVNSFNSGMQYLFNAQYPTNGGWPQVWPIETGDYSRRITYNDNAMVHVMQVMRDLAYQAPLFAFVSPNLRDRAVTSLNKGVDCILKTQIVAGGKKTGWCAQHDEITLLPAAARAYELASQSGKEGAQVLGFLMTLDLARPDVPRQAVVDAVEAAVQFYDSVKIRGIRYVQGPSDAGASDSWIEVDPSAPPLWARFYDPDAPFRPFFCDRNGIKVYTLAEVGVERRGGYTWYVNDPNTIIGTTYPAWVKKWSLPRDVLDAGAGGATPNGSADGSVDGP